MMRLLVSVLIGMITAAIVQAVNGPPIPDKWALIIGGVVFLVCLIGPSMANGDFGDFDIGDIDIGGD